MNSIKQLMVENGLSEECATNICETLTTYKAELKQKLEEEFKVRLSKAKDACLEETKKYKAELSRRVQVFLETKTHNIDKHVVGKLANRETESAATLKRVKSLLEGVQIDSSKNTGDSAAEIKSLRQKVRSLEESNCKMQSAAKRYRDIAERSLTRTKALQEHVLSKQSQTPIMEGKKPQQTQRLDGGRKQGKPQSKAVATVVSEGRTTRTTSMSPDEIAELI